MPPPAFALALAGVPTPGLLLDQQRMDRNIDRLKQHLHELGVNLRPHLKTCKSIDVAQRLLTTPAGPATVSTLKEAEEFAAAGIRDILYAVGIAPAKLDRAVALRNRGVDLSIVVDNLDQARAVAAKCRELGIQIPT
ncbi:MAG TPA: alanine racemase, partial [Steroidobacter sp.]|nr:alanine racemase [Steroidobacter sp.]